MEFTINRTKRNLIILSSSFLILHIFIERLFYFLNSSAGIDTIQIVVKNVVFLIPYGYLMLVFFDYFRHYKLKILQISILSILIMDVFFKANLFTNLFDSTMKLALFITSNAVWFIATIILIVFLFQIKKKDYPEIPAIRKYTISTILLFILVPTIPFFVKPESRFATLQLVGLTSAIPYIFTIDFAIKLFPKK